MSEPNRPAFYHLRRPDIGRREVEVWSGYPLQFEGQRRFPWQDSMATDLRAALAELTMAPDEALAGTYMSTDMSRCDAENRLFTNPGTSIFPKVTRVRFEWIPGPPPEPPEPVSRVQGNLYYYRYRPGGSWEWWQPAAVLANWRHVPARRLSAGNARPAWLAMKRAAAAGQINVSTSAALNKDVPFGIRIIVHAPKHGPRYALTISESLIDGTVAAFHAGAGNAPDIAAVLAVDTRSWETSRAELEKLAAVSSPGPFFDTSPFSGPRAWISPSDDRCYAGEVEIRRDARGAGAEVSGELFTLRTVMA